MVILILRLYARLPTIWQDSPARVYAFSDEGVFQVSVMHADPGDFRTIAKAFPKYTYTWVLFESNKGNIAPTIPITGFFAIQAASPRREYFEWFPKKHIDFWYMKVMTVYKLVMA